MERSQTFRELIVWQKAHGLVLAIYALTSGFPKVEAYGLTSQLRRAAVSIPANIVEGYKRRGRLEKARFMNVAQASLEECRYYLILSQDLGYARTDQLAISLDEVGRLLNAYARAILSAVS